MLSVLLRHPTSVGDLWLGPRKNPRYRPLASLGLLLDCEESEWLLHGGRAGALDRSELRSLEEKGETTKGHGGNEAKWKPLLLISLDPIGGAQRGEHENRPCCSTNQHQRCQMHNDLLHAGLPSQRIYLNCITPCTGLPQPACRWKAHANGSIRLQLGSPDTKLEADDTWIWGWRVIFFKSLPAAATKRLMQCLT